jgi:hypothetical protein
VNNVFRVRQFDPVKLNQVGHIAAKFVDAFQQVLPQLKSHKPEVLH